MGKAYSYFNIWAISSILYSSIDDVERLLQYIEINNKLISLKRNDSNLLTIQKSTESIKSFI